MTDRKSIQNLNRNFVIPAGTQVVLMNDVKVSDSDSRSTFDSKSNDPSRSKFKKAGSVGVVIKCPPHNGQPYMVRFTDGTTTEIGFDEVVLRRQEIENLLQHDDVNYRPWIIYRCQVGSKAFGLSNESSDDDYRGIFLPPAAEHWSMFKMPEQVENKRWD